MKTKREQKSSYYSLNNILKRNAEYNIIFGERSNGKTYAALLYGLTNYVKFGKQCAYIRRWKEDYTKRRAETMYGAIVSNGELVKLGISEQFDNIVYQSGKWYLAKYDPKTKKIITDNKPFCYAFALSEVEHDKSTSYPNVTTIIFDEFLTRRTYLVDEFVIFMNVLSTIIRQRGDVKVFMLGNSVNRYCPYFVEMGLKNIEKMQQGSIDLYQFGENGAKIAVEYTKPTSKAIKESNKYFCFDNQNLQMITSGKWELAAYPHLPIKYTPKDILFVFFIEFNDNLLQGEVISKEDSVFLYIHRKTTPLKDGVLTYTLKPSNSPYVRRKIISSVTEIEKKIATLIVTDKCFFQDNEVGEIVRNYIVESTKSNVLKV